MKDNKVVAIIINWNNHKDTIECVKSILNSYSKPSNIIVVDNASTDNSIMRIIEENFNRLDIVRSDTNLGFGVGNNKAFQKIRQYKSRPDYIWLINPDTIVDEFALDEMIKVLDSNATYGAVGCRLLYFGSHDVQALSGGYYNRFTGISKHITEISEIDKLEFITAASILIRYELIEKIDFDDRFFLYWEDVDLSLAIRKQGYKLVHCDSAIVYHKESQSLGKRSPKLDYYFTHSTKIFFKKNHKWYIVPIFYSTIRRVLHRLLTRRIKNLPEIFRGLLR